jgi:hypothetical protein
MSMNESCPVCDDPAQCRAYPHLWKRLREDPERWRAVHDRLNGKQLAYPSIATQAGNAVKALAGFVADGFRTVDDAEQARRFEICRSCDSFDRSQGRCILCGCVARWKARLASQDCPIGKW